MKQFVILAFLALIFAPAAYAQALDPQAQILKGQIEGFIEAQKATALKNGCTLTTNGNVTVEKANGYYAFTLPHITYTDAKNVRSEIGMVAINATPDGTDNWKVSLALPTPINSFSGKQQLARTDISSQTISGVWNTKLGHFTALNGNLNKVQVNDLVKQNTVTIGNVTVASKLNELEPTVWTGKADTTFNSISIFSADTNFTATLPKIAMTTNLADRAATTPLTKEQIAARPQEGQADAYHIFAMLMGAPERVKATVTGLDSINTQLQQAMLTAPANTRQDFLGAILTVSAISGIGQSVPNDVSSKSYDVVFGQGGQVSINGTDFGSILTAKK